MRKKLERSGGPGLDDPPYYRDFRGELKGFPPVVHRILLKYGFDQTSAPPKEANGSKRVKKLLPKAKHLEEDEHGEISSDAGRMNEEGGVDADESDGEGCGAELGSDEETEEEIDDEGTDRLMQLYEACHIAPLGLTVALSTRFIEVYRFPEPLRAIRLSHLFQGAQCLSPRAKTTGRSKEKRDAQRSLPKARISKDDAVQMVVSAGAKESLPSPLCIEGEVAVLGKEEYPTQEPQRVTAAATASGKAESTEIFFCYLATSSAADKWQGLLYSGARRRGHGTDTKERVAVGVRRREAGGGRSEERGVRSEARGRRQEAGGRRQEAGATTYGWSFGKAEDVSAKRASKRQSNAAGAQTRSAASKYFATKM
ncbi:hypothetical protein BDK51DRAFT_27819 [Blyttiomyces helicus]|uniref:Uncharacterized protein n=1 Tax=Blyttiomyces helicus TaxID=388810 RepID=A0A4P9WN87_9FUNG|nr:hypothetical protein BDK51DRAFT_27819 [Blyttiomyces helicus]|eukprot:RKO94559.1 hypothetical protein BDK51DRAFT_27819 [Blyttiomyces helicus]